MLRKLSTLLLASALALGLAGPALSHAVLLGSTPRADASLDSSPPQIIFNFNEYVGPIFIKILDRTGLEVGDPDAWRADGNDIIMPLTGELPNGTYIVTYRVISADTHPVGGSVIFAVGEDVAAMTDLICSSSMAIPMIMPSTVFDMDWGLNRVSRLAPSQYASS